MHSANFQMKRIVSFYTVFLTVLFLTLSFLSQASAQEAILKVKIVYLYENYCGSCDVEGDFIKQYNELIGGEKKGVDVELLMYNVFLDSGLKKAEQLYSEYNVPKDKQSAPAIFIGDHFLIGDDEINKNLKDAFVAAKEAAQQAFDVTKDKQPSTTSKGEQGKDNTHLQAEGFIAYFYVSSCADCRETEEYLNSINDRLLNIRKYNIAEQEGLELIKEYFRAYSVPEDKQSVPVLFINDTYLSGVQNIKDELAEQVEKGKGISTLNLMENLSDKNGQKNTGAEALTGYRLIGITAAGLVNGLNPCSISMLLFFLSMLLAQNMNVLKMGLSFITGKLVTYCLLGTVLYSLLTRFDIPWFQTATKVILLVFVIIIAILNIRDFIAAKNENYGKIHLQLPVFLRQYNHKWIKKVTTVDNGKPLMLICFGLGALITMGEFLCTGQIYLATIIYVLHNSPVFNMQAAVYFIAYGVAFIAPLLLLTILIHKGREVFELSEFFREKMHVVKLINTLVFVIFGIIVLIWF
jgi:glutaredoxin